MLSGDLLKLLRDLNRADKFHAIQVLISDLAKEETDRLNSDLPDESSYNFGDRDNIELRYEIEDLDDTIV